MKLGNTIILENEWNCKETQEKMMRKLGSWIFYIKIMAWTHDRALLSVFWVTS